MRFDRLLAFFLATLLAASSAHAQAIPARGPGGAAVAVDSTNTENGVAITISVAGHEPQKLEGVGNALVPLKAGNRNAPIVAADIDGDGVDEILIRTSTGNAGVLLVLRWNAAVNAYAPVPFTEDGAQKRFLMVDLSQPVSFNGKVIEANHDKFESGRMRLRVSRYRWDGSGFTYGADN
jgi:hypothetical protein